MNNPSDLAGRYALAVDERDRVALTSLFTADAEFVQPPAVTRGAEHVVTVGGDAIVAVVLDGTAHLHGTRHEVHQQVIDVDGDTAVRVGVPCLAHHLYRGRDGMRDNAIAIRYRDDYDRGRTEAGRSRVANSSSTTPRTTRSPCPASDVPALSEYDPSRFGRTGTGSALSAARHAMNRSSRCREHLAHHPSGAICTIIRRPHCVQ